MITSVFLSVVMVFSFPDGTHATKTETHQFTGPTAIEYCINASGRLNSKNTADHILVIKATCIPS